jgi:hypothetical protein
MILANFGGVFGVVPYFWSQPFVVNWLGVIQTGEAQAWILRLGDVCSHFCLSFKYLQNICGYGLKVNMFGTIHELFFSCQPSLNRRFFLNHAVFGQDLDLDELGGLITWSPAPWVAWASDVCQVGRSWDRDEFSLNSHFLFQIPRYPRYPRSIPDFFLVHFGEATQL